LVTIYSIIKYDSYIPILKVFSFVVSCFYLALSLISGSRLESVFLLLDGELDNDGYSDQIDNPPLNDISKPGSMVLLSTASTSKVPLFEPESEDESNSDWERRRSPQKLSKPAVEVDSSSESEGSKSPGQKPAKIIPEESVTESRGVKRKADKTDSITEEDVKKVKKKKHWRCME